MMQNVYLPGETTSPVVKYLTVRDLDDLAEAFAAAAKRGMNARVMIDSDGFKVSYARGVWSRGMGSGVET